MFIEKPANKKSISNRKLVHGFGVNDAAYMVRGFIDNNRTACPYYVKWSNMITRCYSAAEHKRNATYKDCTVCDEWLSFLSFKSWMINQDWEGNELDKDIIKQGNRVYSPKNCLFVSKKINSLLTSCKASRGIYPQGVHRIKNTNSYRAIVHDNGRLAHLGLFENPSLAHEAYKKAKYKIIADVAENQTEPLKSSLLNYKISEY